MTTTVHRGWLIAALVVALLLLVGSVAAVGGTFARHLNAQPGVVEQWGRGPDGGSMMDPDDLGPRTMMNRDGQLTPRGDRLLDCRDAMDRWEDD